MILYHDTRPPTGSLITAHPRRLTREEFRCLRCGILARFNPALRPDGTKPEFCKDCRCYAALYRRVS